MNPEIEELEDILDAILKAVQEVIQSGEPISDDFQKRIADEINLINSEIEDLYLRQSEISPEQTPEQIEEREIQQVPPSGGQPQIPELESAPYASSNINAFRYNPKEGKLFVKFQGKYPKQNGSVYSYEGVPNYIFDIFKRGAVGPKTSGKNAWHTWKQGVTPSHGAAMNALLKAGGFSYQRLS